MTKPFRRAVFLASFGAVVTTFVVVVLPGNRARAIDLYVLFLGAVILFALVRVTANDGAQRKSALDRVEGERRAAERLPELARIEREVFLATAQELRRVRRLNSLLRDIARHRLWTRRGIDLDREPDRARGVLGDDAWDVIASGAASPEDGAVPQLELERLRGVVDTLERV